MPVLLLLLACKSAPPVDSGPQLVPQAAPVEDGWLRGDLHFHTNYSEDALEQGGDDLAAALDIADAWRADAWVDAHPELAEDHLHFVAVTDHRTTAGMADPDFRHDFLVVLGGEEFGSDGHAGVWGTRDHVPHEPQGGESRNQRLNDAIAEVHAQGGLFSPNHPADAGDLWSWDTPDVDAVEVWNGPWSVMGMPTTPEEAAAWVVGAGVENPMVAPAVAAGGGGRNAQAVRFWQATLSAGRHVPPVGGGDRHVLFPAGLPTTYVNAPTRDEAGVIAGIAAGATFVSRSPQGPQVVLTAEVGGQSFPMGAALPPGEVTVRWRVARADGGQLRLLTGVVDPSLPDPELLTSIDLDGDDVSGAVSWSPPSGGGWLHAVVVEPMPEVPAELEDAVAALTAFPEGSGITDLLRALGPLVDLEHVGHPTWCEPEDWAPFTLQCMPADTLPMGSYYAPPEVQRLLSVEFADRQATGWTMGAISAAFMSGAP